MTEEQYDEWAICGRLPCRKNGSIDLYQIERALRNETNAKRRLLVLRRLLEAANKRGRVMPKMTCPTCRGSGKITGSLGARLKLAREARGLTLRDVEAKTSMANATVSQIESGRNKGPSIHRVKELADLYGIKIDELLQD